VVFACLVATYSSLASAQTVSECEAQGKFLVTAYGFADNDPAYSDAIATVGQNANWRANFLTTNTFSNPGTLAVRSDWLGGTGNFSTYVNDPVAPRSSANWSERLVDGMEQQEDLGTIIINTYDSQPSWVHWSGVDGATLWKRAPSARRTSASCSAAPATSPTST
jgi:hypothetical protein